MTVKQIEKRLDELEPLRGALEDAISAFADETESLKSDMQDHFDERSENWQDGEKGQAWQEFIDELDSAASEVAIDVPSLPEITW